MILLIDNYDSFSYNLVQQIGSICPEIRVVRNDACTVEEISAMRPSHIILSPGPGYPGAAGICEDVVRKLQDDIPILGVCLGHQAICEAYGAEIRRASEIMHGKKCVIRIDRTCPLFRGLEEEIEAARYHSLAAGRETVPDVLAVTAKDDDGEVMAIQHKKYPIFGLQFHPESMLTPMGNVIMENFLAIGKGV